MITPRQIAERFIGHLLEILKRDPISAFFLVGHMPESLPDLNTADGFRLVGLLDRSGFQLNSMRGEFLLQFSLSKQDHPIPLSVSQGVRRT